MGWIEHVRESLHRALSAALDLDPESTEALKRIIPAYIENATNTQAPRNVDLCYYAVSPDPGTDLDYIQTSTKIENGSPVGVLKKSIPADVILTFYGPHADDDSEKVWSALQWDYGAGSPRAVLRARKIVLRGKPQRPEGLYETEGTYQRRRCDIRLEIVYLEETARPVPTVDVPPAVTVVRNES